MTAIKRLVFDALIPHDPDTVAFARAVADVSGVDGVTATVLETDKTVENVAMTIDGADVDYEAAVGAVEDLGGTVHSVDQVVCGTPGVRSEGNGTPES
jgi:hypothetical protein